MHSKRYGLVEPTQEHLLEAMLHKHKDGMVVTLGCGPSAKHQANLARFMNEGRVIGVDVLNHDEEYHGQRIGKFTYVRGNVNQLPLADGSADCVIMIGLYGAFHRGGYIFNLGDHQTGALKKAVPLIPEALANLLLETKRILGPHGDLVISNSMDRQPIDEVKQQVVPYFTIEAVHARTAPYT